MWQRFMTRVQIETKITERFTEHDLRAQCASDAQSLEHARALLAHADIRTTKAIYQRKHEFVEQLGKIMQGERAVAQHNTRRGKTRPAQCDCLMHG